VYKGLGKTLFSCNQFSIGYNNRMNVKFAFVFLGVILGASAFLFVPAVSDAQSTCTSVDTLNASAWDCTFGSGGTSCDGVLDASCFNRLDDEEEHFGSPFDYCQLVGSSYFCGVDFISGDTTPPKISNICVEGDCSAPYTTSDPTPQITFDTDENATCKRSGNDRPFSSMPFTCLSTGGTSHDCSSSASVSPGTTVMGYYACEDQAGNSHSSSQNTEITFTVTSGVDNTKPTISVTGPATVLQNKSVTITATAKDSESGLDNINVFVDFNRNGDFNDDGAAGSPKICPFSGSTNVETCAFIIPANTLSLGLYTYRAQAEDIAGNSKNTASIKEFTVVKVGSGPVTCNDPATGEDYALGDIRTQTCGSGECLGTHELTCQSDGEWSDPGPCDSSGFECTNDQGDVRVCSSIGVCPASSGGSSGASGTVVINNGDEETNSRQVTLQIQCPKCSGGPSGLSEMQIKETSDITDTDNREGYQEQLILNLKSAGDGHKTIFVRFRETTSSPWGPVTADFIELVEDSGGGSDPGGGGSIPIPTITIDFGNPLQYNSFTELINGIINFIFTIAVIVAPILLVVAGVLFMTAAGDTNRVTKARNMILWTIIGFAVILVSKGLVTILKEILNVNTP
jgi:hypothetical protein